MTAGTLPQRAAGQRLIAIPIVGGDGRITVRSRWWRCLEPVPALGECLPTVAVGEEPVVPDAVEAGREHMEEDAPDKLRRGEGHGLLAGGARVAVVGVAEADLPRVQIEDPLVGDGDPVRVAPDVIEDWSGPAKGGFA